MRSDDTRNRLRALLRSLCTLVLLAATPVASPQSVAPAAAGTQPVHIVVPFLNGDFEDVIARIIVDQLGKTARRPFVVDNRPGVDGHHGAEVVARARPDGNTLLFAPIVHYAAADGLYVLHYNLLADFTPVTLVANAPQVLVAHPSLPVKSMSELIAFSKAQPGQFKWGWHDDNLLSGLQIDMLKNLSGMNIDSIFFREGNAAMSELLAGRVVLQFDSIVTTLPHIKSGRLRALAVSGTQRAAALPQVPTMAQSGVKGYEADYWYAMLAPEGADPAIVSALRDEIARAVVVDEVKNQLLSHGMEAVTSSSADLARIMREEVAKWARVIKEASGKSK